MKQLNIPTPPNPDAPQYRGNALVWFRAATDWMQRTKGVLETAHNELARPCGQQLLASDFTTNTTVTGTTTGTDLSNFVASLVATLTAKGIISPTVSRQQ